MDHSAIISLYKSEINAYKEQIEALKLKNESVSQKNSSLEGKVRQLENLVEQASVANQDLHTAFKHVTEDNLRLKMQESKQLPEPAALEDTNSKALETVQQQYTDLARESVSWISNKEKMNQRIKFLERECERYHRDNTTLGKQVRHLLRTLEEERGMIIRHQDEVVKDEKMTCAEDVIDGKLVTFESIEELQQQNQKIVSLLKDLSAREEEREKQIESEEAKRFLAEIKNLKEQLTNVRNERASILEALNTIHKERELFKILLSKTRQAEHMTPEIFQRMVSIACSSNPTAPALQSATENEAHIDDLKNMISKLEQDLTQLRNELTESKTRCEEEVRFKSELLDKAHAKIIEESQRADNLNERNEMLETNLKNLMIEFDEVRTKCQRMTFETDQLKLQYEENKGSLDTMERQNRDLTRSLDAEKQSSLRLTVEKEHLERQLQVLNGNLDEERQKSLRAGIENEHLERQIQTLNGALEQERQQLARLRFEKEQLDKQIQALNEALENERRQISKLASEKPAADAANEAASRAAVEEAASRAAIEAANAASKLMSKVKAEAAAEAAELRKQIEIFQQLRNVEREMRLDAELRARKRPSDRKSRLVFAPRPKIVTYNDTNYISDNDLDRTEPEGDTVIEYDGQEVELANELTPEIMLEVEHNNGNADIEQSMVETMEQNMEPEPEPELEPETETVIPPELMPSMVQNIVDERGHEESVSVVVEPISTDISVENPIIESAPVEQVIAPSSGIKLKRRNI